MKQKHVRIWSILLAVVMLLSLLPVSAMAVEGSNVTEITKTVTADLQASRLDGNNWVADDGLSKNADGSYTFVDTADDVYESVGSVNFAAEDKKWEGDTTVEAEVYIDPTEFNTGEGFTMVCDIMPTWRAYVVGIRKLASGEMLVDFSNNSSYAVAENSGNNQKKIESADWYTFRWELFEQDGYVACNLFMNDNQVGVTRTNAADSVENSYFRKFWIPTYGPKPIGGGETEDLEICSDKSLQFKNVTKTVVTGYERTVSTANELKDALANAQDGDIIKLGAPITLGVDGLPGTAISGKNLTIDGCGHKISFTYTQSNPVQHAVFGNDTNPLYAGTNLTVKNLTIENTGTQGGYAAMVGYNANGANIAFEGCTFKNLYAAAYVNPVTTNPASGVDLSITGCTYKDTLHGYAVDTVSPDGYQVVDVTFENNTGSFAESEPVKNVVYATVGDYKKAFKDLATAIAAADENSTVELAPGTYDLNDIEGLTRTGIAINKPVKIVGADKATTIIKITGASGAQQKAFTLGAGSGGTEFKNLTFEMDFKEADSAAIYFNDKFDNSNSDTPVKITNVDFIGADKTNEDTNQHDMAITSASPAGGYVEITDCSFQNLKWGMYFNRMNHLTIENNVFNGTRRSAIRIAADNVNRECSDIVIKNNVLTNISAQPDYNYPEYNSGISFGYNATGIVLENNSIEMLNGRKPIYFDDVENDTRIIVTFMNDGAVYGCQVLEEEDTITLPSKLTKKGYTFLGWKSSADRKVYKAGATVEIYKDTTFTAQWMNNWEIVDDIAGAAGSGKEFFTDVKGSAWYYDAVKFAYDYGFMDGVGDNKFNPNGTLTRAMIAQVLYNLEGETSSYPTVFDDVAKSAWYADAVNWAAASGIVEGKGNNKFDPNAAITRQEMAAILYRYSELKGYDVSDVDSLSSFTDADKVASWAKEPMGWAVENYVINGKGNGKLDPTGTATRAEVAQILMNLCNNVL